MNSAHWNERAIVFECGADRLVGIVHSPAQARDVGVVIVVGGPQYRVGSHRQFVLLARELAAAGFPVLRFDYRGMGDSEGRLLGFERVANDIRAAVDELAKQAPAVKRVVLWGLCDGATASAAYAPTDRRVRGLVLLNPWVRSESTLARSILFHYYARRILNPAAWRDLLGDREAWRKAIWSFASTVKTVVGASRSSSGVAADAAGEDAQRSTDTDGQAKAVPSTPLVIRMAAALQAFDGGILTILSGADITANEFVEAVKGNRKLRRRLGRANVTQHTLPEADHTFSTAHWRGQVERWTAQWLQTL